MDWIWPSHGIFDYVSLPKGKKGKIEGCIILLLDISPQKSCSSWFTSWFTHIWGHTMGVCLMLRDGIRQKTMYTLIKIATFFKKNTRSTMFYTHQTSVQSSMKSNPFNPGQTYDLSVKTHVFLGHKNGPPKRPGPIFSGAALLSCLASGPCCGRGFLVRRLLWRPGGLYMEIMEYISWIWLIH